MRSYLFAVAYWTLTIFYGLLTAVLALFPGRGLMTWSLRRYTDRKSVV